MKKKLLIAGIFIFIISFSSAQKDSTNLIKYSDEFKFKDGFFLNFSQVKNNSPVLKSRVISPLSRDERDFFEKVIQNNKIAYYDNNGVRQAFETSELWGYADNGVLYINVDESFNRLTYIGNISHFIAIVTEYHNTGYDPYMNTYNYGYGMSPSKSFGSKEMKQFLLDFESGKILDYDYKSLLTLLMKDPELYDEYNSLKRKDKKKLKFFYIRKFNERNPLYFSK